MRRALILITLLALGCGDDAVTTEERSLNELLNDRVRLKLGMLIDESLPAASDGTVNLIELGPVSLLEPGGVEILALEVEDPEEREVVATLLQFGTSASHLRAPAEANDNIVSNELETTDTLCDGLCASVITAHANVAVELEDGEISAAVEIEITIDCREHGDPEQCDEEHSSGPVEDELICNDVTGGAAALTGDEQIDAYFDAVRTLALVSELTQDDALDAQADLRDALALEGEGDVVDALQDRIDGATDGGLVVVLGERGCGVRGPRVLHALRTCDPQGTADVLDMECSGVCEGGLACLFADSPGCRGVVQDESCDGTCTGACQAELETPGACNGTCFGTCDGECATPDGDECAGPCAGNCDGECRGLSDAVCSGSCTGLCDALVPGDEDVSCEAPLELYCATGTDSLACSADCFGDVDLEHDGELCKASAIATGRAAARCEAPIVQLLFAYAPELSGADQESFSELVGEIDAPIATLLALLSRVELLIEAGMDLQAVGGEPLDERIVEVEEELEPSAIACAKTTQDGVDAWITGEIEVLEALRADIIALYATLTPSAN